MYRHARGLVFAPVGPPQDHPVVPVLIVSADAEPDTGGLTKGPDFLAEIMPSERREYRICPWARWKARDLSFRSAYVANPAEAVSPRTRPAKLGGGGLGPHVRRAVL